MLSTIQKIFLGFLFILAYFSIWPWMWDRWFSYDSYYSHGILIPIISVVLIWLKRKELKKIPPQRSIWGFWLFAAGLLIHFIGLLFRIYFISAFTMIPVLAGLVLCFWGKRVFEIVAFPILFLFFMIPLPLVAVINISFEMKLLAASLATMVLNIINVPAVQNGSYIQMAHATVIVEDVCSGLRSLIALLALGALFAYWLKAGKAKKTLLFLASVPIAILTNMIRIIVLAMIAEFLGVQYITPAVHEIFGLMVFVLAFFFLSKMEKMLTYVKP